MKKVHFIGICGKGMSAVAKLLIDMGVEVTGSDEGFYPPVSTYIENNNIPFIKGYSQDNIPIDVDTIVIGKHARLVESECDEVKKAFDLQRAGKVVIKSFPEIIQEIVKNRQNLVVAGSYGKSTCTALLSHVLENSGQDIGYFIGATPLTPNQNAKLGTGKIFVLEGDEYPSANWDMSSKFLYYKPSSVLLTALAHDHTNIFKTHQDFINTFFELFKIIPDSGKLLACLDEKTISNQKQNILKSHANTVFYSLDNLENSNEIKYFAKNVNYAEISTFDFCRNNEILGNVKTSLLGKHNLQNIVGAIAFILENTNTSFEDIQKGVESFIALEGRLNELSTKNSLGVKVFEGFGSSVDKARSALDAILLHFPKKNVKIIFEPHTFSWRNKEAITWYDTVFLGAKKVYVYEPPTHGSQSITQSTQKEIVDRINMSGVEAVEIVEQEIVIDKIKKELDFENDIILTLSSSDFGGLIAKLVLEL